MNVAGDAQREGNFENADEILHQVLREHALHKLPIDVLCPLTIRAWNAMRNDVNNDNVIVTIADLIRCPLMDTGWYNFGKVSRALLGERMRTFGLNFTKQSDYAWIKMPKKHKQHDRFLLLPIFCVASVSLQYAIAGDPEGMRYRDGRTIPWYQRQQRQEILR